MSTAFAGRHTMDSPEWYTPSPFVEAARVVMGAIDLDPASCYEANRIVRAARYFTAEDDGLAQVWAGRVFLNPPGGLVKAFWDALMLARRDIEQAIWIGYSLEQLQTLQGHGRPTPLDFPMCVPSRRIAFVPNEARTAARLAAGKKAAASPSHGNYISYLGPNVEGFVREFSRFGQVRR